MLIKIRKYIFQIATALVILSFLILPYWLFNGKLFIGGDDTRLYYVYPELFLHNISISSWFNFSSVGTYNPNFFLIPFLYVLSAVHIIIRSKAVFSYLFFSLPLIGGFIFFQMFISECIGVVTKERWTVFLGSLIYTLSPILIIGQLDNFLYCVWLIALIPALLYFYLKFVKSGHWKYILFAGTFSIIVAQALFSIPWLLGLLIPLAGTGLVFLIFFEKNKRFIYLIRSLIFFSIIGLLQSFWLIPFSASFIGQSTNSFGASALSAETANTFAATVNATATGNIIYPLTNLFFRKIAFDFHWELTKIFLSLYDKTIFLGLIFVVILFLGVKFLPDNIVTKRSQIYISFFSGLLISLFLFTVNIGPFKQLYLKLGALPGFAMFRNGFDKFALGYTFLFAALITIALVLARNGLIRSLNGRRFYSMILILVSLDIFINFIPIKELINKPLWTTDDIKTVTNIPDEYTDFMKTVQSNVPNTSSILSLPYGESSYSIVNGSDEKSALVGRSPIQLFTGLNDFSGKLSFPSTVANNINTYINQRDYIRLNNLLSSYNISYAIVANHVNSEILSSYLFNPFTLAHEDQTMYASILGKKIAMSKDGNYSLYQLKSFSNSSSIISATKTFYTVYDQANLASNNGANDGNIINQLQSLFTSSKPLAIDQTGGIPVIPLKNGNDTKIDDSKYSIFQSYPNIGTLIRNADTDSLDLRTGANGSSNGSQFPISTTKISDNFSADEVVKINGRFIDSETLDNQNGYTVGSQDEAVEYTPIRSDQSLITSLVNTEWHQENCHTTQNTPTTKFTFNQNSVILEAMKNQNACIWREFKIDPTKTYRIQFDYQSDQKDLSMNITDDKANLINKFSLPDSGDNKMHHFSDYFTPSNLSIKNIRAYLYSGESQTLATSQYQNVQITEYVPLKKLQYTSELSDATSENGNINVNGSIFKSNTSISTYDPNLLNFEDWNKSDCNNINSEQGDTTFVNVPGGGVSLSAQNEHKACIYKTIDINPNDIYTLDLKYEHSDSNELYIDFGNKHTPKIVQLPRSGDLNTDIIAPSDSLNMTIYLYSNSNNDIPSVKYTDISLSYYPLSQYGVYIMSNSSSAGNTLKTVVQKITQFKYHASVSNAPSSSFLLQLNDSFNNGWKIGNSDATNNQLENSIKHIQINGYANGWVINTATYCIDNDACSKNSDGTYNIDFSIGFQPQRLFNIGLSISALFYAIICGLCLYQLRNKRPI